MTAGASILQWVLVAAVGAVFLVVAWKVFANLVKALFWLGIFILLAGAILYFTRGPI